MLFLKKSHNIWIYAYTPSQITNGMGMVLDQLLSQYLVTNVVQFLVLKKHLVVAILLEM
jgi:hypothetical protein